MDYFYMVVHVYIDDTGKFCGEILFYYDVDGETSARNKAESKFHEILSEGAVSKSLYCGASVKHSDGTIIKPFEFYDRRPVHQDAA